MKRIKIVTIFLLLFSLFSFLFLFNYSEERVFAQTTCPPNMDPESVQCLDYLRDQLEKIQREQGQVERRLKDEEYEQLSLSEQITYINNQINQTENNIKTLEVEIAALDIEIRLLERSIREMEDHISILGQETSILENSVNKRITESYKYSFVGPLELFLDVRNLSSIIRKTKYLAITRTQDRRYLEVYTHKISEMRREEQELADTRAQVQVKRNSLDENKIDLANEREVLSSSRAEQSRLLAESRRREAQLEAQLQDLIKRSNQVAEKISAMIMTLFRQGQIPVHTPVKAGDIIGFQGHTGFAYGSHLHFNLSGAGTGPLELGYFRIQGGRVYDGNAVAPLGNGAYLTQGYHAGYSLDMVGLYNWNGDRYYVAPNTVCCTGSFAYLGCIPEGWYNLNGEGTPVRAIKDGMVSAVRVDPCGGKYVVIDHGGGEASLYLHLR